eukprot:CAMPEP_0172175762 /NCGR_PEP_ID=MMETSP1050-20130122/14414_1 /TAXON_ID=233186 /ORGANISM="Cryptomonas curvata, Strain CCAP979/52" /LENGTH=318 /DNA_ID=CAMNT_0012847913 /DNA_START=123 /DNA_END=1079 /DNA_ORIENTATION=-
MWLSLRKHNFAPIFLLTVTLFFLTHHCSAETLNLSNGDKIKISADQEEMIKAVKNENYEQVASLAAGAKQRKEYEQVARDTLRKVEGLGGYSAVQVDAFFSSLMMIIVSELGDKTFFIAAIMAMKHPRGIVLAGALGALGLMTVLSAAAGFALPSLLPRVYTHYASVVLFAVFGVKLLKDAREMKDEGHSEELEEVEAELNKADKKKNPDVEATAPAYNPSGFVINAVLWQAFTLTFLAEWGDRSQIATIALAAQKDPWGVAAGGTLGHAACTSIAVVGGRMLATKISERTVSYSGGALFLVFALHGLWQGGSGLHNA